MTPSLQQLSHHVSALADNHRSKHNLSITDLARELGVTRSQMERVLEGYCEELCILEKVLEGMGMEVVQTKDDMTHDQLLAIYWASNPGLFVQGRKANGLRIISIDPKPDGIWFTTTNGYDHLGATLKPYLKPLSSITDEDAIAVANMAFFLEAPDWRIKERRVHRTTLHSYKANKFVEIHFNMSDIDVYDDDPDCTPSQTDNSFLKITDYLRSKGYNLDFEPGQFIEV